MILVWRPVASIDRQQAIAYIAEDNPRAALDQLNEIERQTDKLLDYPDIGRIGRVPGTQELVISRTPFILVYRVHRRAGRIEILRLLHGARRWP